MENNESELKATAEEIPREELPAEGEVSPAEPAEPAEPAVAEVAEVPAAEPEAMPEMMPEPVPVADPEVHYGSVLPEKAGKYRVLSLLIFLLTAGGLFLGLLGKFAAWLSPSYYHEGEGLNNSLLGFFFARMKQLFTGLGAAFAGSFWEDIMQVIAILAACLVAVSVIVSLVTFIMTLASSENAKRATAIGGTVSFLTYTLLFVWACCVKGLALDAFSMEVIDVPVAFITLALFVVMTIFSVIENGGRGLLSAGIYLFAVAACFALFFPGSFTESNFVLLEAYSVHPIYNSLVLATTVVAAADLVVSVIAFPKQGRGALRVALFTLQLALVVALAATACLLDEAQKFAFFVGSALLPSVVLFFATIGALLLSAIILLAERKKSETADHAEPVEVSDLSADGSALAAESLGEPVAYGSAEPVSGPTSVYEPASEVLPASDAEPPLLPVSSLPPLPEAMPEPLPVLPEEVPAPAVSEYPAEPAEEKRSAPIPESGAVPKPEDEPLSGLSAFEREMLSLARQKQTEPTVSEEAPFPPYAQSAPVQRPLRPIDLYSDPSTKYLYDPFINELTPEEKDEFGDLFIACKSGKFGDLPSYTIGGNNKEFFEKVWIRYGLYDMSQSLRDKLFNYVRKYRSR